MVAGAGGGTPLNVLLHLRGGCVALAFAHLETTKRVRPWICARGSRVRCKQC